MAALPARGRRRAHRWPAARSGASAPSWASTPAGSTPGSPWVVGDGLGVLVVVPLFVSYTRARRRSSHAPRAGCPARCSWSIATGLAFADIGANGAALLPYVMLVALDLGRHALRHEIGGRRRVRRRPRGQRRHDARLRAVRGGEPIRRHHHAADLPRHRAHHQLRRRHDGQRPRRSRRGAPAAHPPGDARLADRPPQPGAVRRTPGRRACRPGEHGSGLAVLLVDLDDFKKINDRHGHPIGDAALRAAAERLGTSVRPGDLLARLGGDEFVVLCEGITGAEQVAGDRRGPDRRAGRRSSTSAARSTSSPAASASPSSTPTIRPPRPTCCTAPTSPSTTPSARAGVSVSLFDDALEAQTRRRVEMHEELRRRDRPRRDARRVPARGLAGVRSRLGARGPRPLDEPALRIGRARRVHRRRRGHRGRSAGSATGCSMSPASSSPTGGRQTSATAGAASAARGQRVGPPALRHRASPTGSAGRSPQAGLPADALTLEITETADDGRRRRRRSACSPTSAPSGVRLSMDDFGTGYSSMSNLRRHPGADPEDRPELRRRPRARRRGHGHRRVDHQPRAQLRRRRRRRGRRDDAPAAAPRAPRLRSGSGVLLEPARRSGRRGRLAVADVPRAASKPGQRRLTRPAPEPQRFRARRRGGRGRAGRRGPASAPGVSGWNLAARMSR